MRCVNYDQGRWEKIKSRLTSVTASDDDGRAREVDCGVSWLLRPGAKGSNSQETGIVDDMSTV